MTLERWNDYDSRQMKPTWRIHIYNVAVSLTCPDARIHLGMQTEVNINALLSDDFPSCGTGGSDPFGSSGF